MYEQEKRLICEIGRRIYEKGFVAANDGNLSIKVSDDRVLVTPTGVSKGFMTPEMILLSDMNANTIDNTTEYRLSSEFKMHLQVYRDRPDAGAIVHAHPPFATAFAVCGMGLCDRILPEALLILGDIPLAPYATPSTQEVPDSVAGMFERHDAVLLQNHGALTVGPELMNAYFKLETLEHLAKVDFFARQLGAPRVLTESETQKIMDVRNKMSLPGKHPLADG